MYYACFDLIEEIITYASVEDISSLLFVNKKISNAARKHFDNKFANDILMFVRAIQSNIIFVKNDFPKHGIHLFDIIDYNDDPHKIVVTCGQCEDRSWKCRDAGNKLCITKIGRMKYYTKDVRMPEIVYGGFYDKNKGICFLVGDPGQPSVAIFTTSVTFHGGSLWSLVLPSGDIHWFAARSFGYDHVIDQDYIFVEGNMVYCAKYNKFYKCRHKKMVCHSSLLELPDTSVGCCVIV